MSKCLRCTTKAGMDLTVAERLELASSLIKVGDEEHYRTANRILYPVLNDPIYADGNYAHARERAEILYEQIPSSYRER